MTDLKAAVRSAVDLLRDAGVPSPESDAVSLAAHAMGTSPSAVHSAMVLGQEAPATYQDLVAQRAARVPLQHLTGKVGFRGLELEVGPGVFVPRPETEVLAGIGVDAARRALAAGTERPIVVDLCAGSGAVALSIKDEVPEAAVYAVEVCELAHGWAVRNVTRTGLDIELVRGDATTALPELEAVADVVVSNPPYIPSGQEPVDPEVRDHDPQLALYGGSADGLAIPRLVAARAAMLLRPGGLLAMEHADSQGGLLRVALTRTGDWMSITDRVDLSGRPRVTVATRR